MAARYQVPGTLRKIEKRFRLIPDAELPPELQDVEIFCKNRLGPDEPKVYDDQHETFLVQRDEPGGASVIAIVSRARTAPATAAPDAVPDAAVPDPPAAAPRDAFIHPYNFVRLPSQEALQAALDIEPFQRGPSAPHDRYDPQLNTGFIDCELTTHTDWFIPDPRKVHPNEDGHDTLGYFTLESVDPSLWKKGPPSVDTTEPAIPGSSLRGMVRSVFEAATLSCFGVFHGGRLEFRATRLLQGRGYRFVPARVLQADGPTADLQLLPSRLGNDQVAGAHHRCYTVTKERDKVTNVQFAGTLQNNPSLPSGARLIAVVKQDSTQHPFPAYFYRKAPHVIPIPDTLPENVDLTHPPLADFLDEVIAAQQAEGGRLIFGYFCRTGWNIERKHDEKVFYSTNAAYNGQDADTTADELLTRLKLFLSDQTPTTTADADVVDRFNASLEEYERRHREQITPVPRDPTLSTSIQLSDFVVAGAALHRDQLVYAVVEPSGRVLDLYPVSLPRVWHQDTMADLLPQGLSPCSRSTSLDAHESLCPACRVFGWVRELREEIGGQADRIDAVAGHVRFTHGVVLESRNTALAVTPTPLPVLGSPHPTCTEFYLREHDDFSDSRASRTPPDLSNQQSFPFPMYRNEEAVLRGRKFSRRRSATSPESHEPAVGGLTRPKDEHGTPGLRNKHNQTVYLLPKDMKFSFRVYFDNLSDPELGALLFALNLTAPPAWQEAIPGDAAPLFHTLGHGTRLGMGCCSIRILGVQLDAMDPDNPNCRYTAITDVVSAPPKLSAETPRAAIHAFARSWRSLVTLPDGDAAEEFKLILSELLDMLRVCDGPVHYPNCWPASMSGEVEYFDSFTWFMANRRRSTRPRREPGKHTLPSPCDESSGICRLPLDPTTG